MIARTARDLSESAAPADKINDVYFLKKTHNNNHHYE